MFHLILKRLLWMIPTLFAISFISFALIQLPPGDYLTSYVTALAETGEGMTNYIAALGIIETVAIFVMVFSILII